MVKCGGNQLNAELKGRWDAGQISGLLKSHHVPGGDLILCFNYRNSVYLLLCHPVSQILCQPCSFYLTVSLFHVPLLVSKCSKAHLNSLGSAASSASPADVASPPLLSRLPSHSCYFQSIPNPTLPSCSTSVPTSPSFPFESSLSLITAIKSSFFFSWASLLPSLCALLCLSLMSVHAGSE